MPIDRNDKAQLPDEALCVPTSCVCKIYSYNIIDQLWNIKQFVFKFKRKKMAILRSFLYM